jgi:membrane-bound lytic murein transglycosylase B
MTRKYADALTRIERDYGVPEPVIAAFWGLETDFGAFMGNFSALRSLATLAYDCRRPDYFHAELLDALRIVDRGYLEPENMRGAWAGELGQVQFTPSNYLKYAVDYDGDERRDLVGSVEDALASTANYIRALGWKRDEPCARRRHRALAGIGAGDSPAAILLGRCRSRTRRREAAPPRPQAGGADPADGATWPGLPGLREFRHLLGVEPEF